MNAVDAMKAVLREQLRCCRSLLSVLQKERARLVDFDVAGIEELAKEKDTLLLQIRLLDEERARLAARVGGEAARTTDHCGAPNESPRPEGADMTLKRLAELTGDPALSELRLALKSLLESIEDLNGFNRVLIERSLDTLRAGAGFLGALGASAAGAKAAGALVWRRG